MLPEIIPRFPVNDAELSALHDRAFGQPLAPVRPWAARLNRHALTWLGAFHHATLIGFIQVAWDGGDHAFLLDTAVDPSWQHRGIGARLVESAVAEATSAGCTWLHVDYEPHLSSFYQDRCGFAPTRAGLLRLTP